MNTLTKPLCILLLLMAASAPAYAEPDWQALPPTPQLPEAQQSDTITVNGAQIWYAMFGHGSPIVMVHGGLANASYWGREIPVLAKNHQVIVLDSRGHGRSGYRPGEPITYDLIASDVLALMDHLHIQKAALIGWSDGAVIGLNIAINHPDRLEKLFAFGGDTTPEGVKDIDGKPAFKQYLSRVQTEYNELSPTPDNYKKFLETVTGMWNSVDISAAELEKITVPTWIVAGDHGIIKTSNTDFMLEHIQNAEELILPGVGHFAFIQRPKQFNAALLWFLEWTPSGLKGLKGDATLLCKKGCVPFSPFLLFSKYSFKNADVSRYTITRHVPSRSIPTWYLQPRAWGGHHLAHVAHYQPGHLAKPATAPLPRRPTRQ